MSISDEELRSTDDATFVKASLDNHTEIDDEWLTKVCDHIGQTPSGFKYYDFVVKHTEDHRIWH